MSSLAPSSSQTSQRKKRPSSSASPKKLSRPSASRAQQKSKQSSQGKPRSQKAVSSSSRTAAVSSAKKAQRSVSGATAVKSSSVSSHSQKTTVDFRFQCDPQLRDQLNERLKFLRIDRSLVMESFIKEWLRQTDSFTNPSQT